MVNLKYKNSHPQWGEREGDMKNGAFLVESYHVRSPKREIFCISESKALEEAERILRASKHLVAIQISRERWWGNSVHLSNDEVLRKLRLPIQIVGVMISD